jgi:hypothetical protein
VLDDDLIRSCRGALDCTPFFRQNRKIHPCTIIYAWLNFVSQLRKQSNPIPELSKSTRRRSPFPSGRLAISGTRTRYTSMNGESSPNMGHTSSPAMDSAPPTAAASPYPSPQWPPAPGSATASKSQQRTLTQSGRWQRPHLANEICHIAYDGAVPGVLVCVLGVLEGGGVDTVGRLATAARRRRLQTWTTTSADPGREPASRRVQQALPHRRRSPIAPPRRGRNGTVVLIGYGVARG